MRIGTFFLLLGFPLYLYSENPEFIKIYYIPLEMESPYNISPYEFDRLHINSCDSIIIRDDSLLSVFLSEMDCLHDTIIERHIPDRIYKKQNGENIRIQLYPKIDTRGKITISYPKHNDVLYFSKFRIWNSTNDTILRMSDKLKKIIQNLFRGESIENSENQKDDTTLLKRPKLIFEKGDKEVKYYELPRGGIFYPL